MTQIEHARVVDKDGLIGTIVERLPPDKGGVIKVLVRFDDGQQVLVPGMTLVAQQDGSYYLPVSRATLEQATSTTGVTAKETLEQATVATDVADRATVVLPVIEEALDVQRRTVETGRVRVSKLVREHQEVVDEPLLREQVDVERVSINRVVDSPMEVRREGDTLIIPILEEVLVVEKRLMLKEEVRVRMQRTEAHEPQQVTLRSEEVVVERVDPQGLRKDSGTDPA